MAELVVSTITIDILAIALPIFSMQIYDRVLPNHAGDTLAVMVAGVTVAVILEITLRLARAKMIAEEGANFEKGLSRSAVSHLLNAKQHDLGAQSASLKLQKLQAARPLRDFHSGYALTVLIDFAFIFLYLALIFHIGGWIILAPLAIIVLIIGNGLMRSLQLREAIQSRRTADLIRYDFLVSALQSISALKSFALGPHFSRRYEPLEYKTSLANFRVSRNSAQILNTSAVLGNVMSAAVVTVGAMTALKGGLSIGGLIACVLLSGRLIPPLQRGVILWIKFQEYDVSRRMFLSLFEGDAHAAVVEEGAPAANAPALELRNVGVARRRGAPPLFDAVSVTLRKDDVAIVRGASPRQASMLLKMIAGLAEPKEGEILVDGIPAHAIALTRRADHIAYLSASAELFQGTILENLTSFGLRDARQGLEAARLLGIDKDVARLPNGWNTHISGRAGDETPLGLRQRIAIARALAGRPSVLLLDDPGELLDNRGYDLMVSTLARLRTDCAILLNTSDENLICFANRELRFGRDGRLDISIFGRRTRMEELEGGAFA